MTLTRTAALATERGSMIVVIGKYATHTERNNNNRSLTHCQWEFGTLRRAQMTKNHSERGCRTYLQARADGRVMLTCSLAKYSYRYVPHEVSVASQLLDVKLGPLFAGSSSTTLTMSLPRQSAVNA